MQIGEPSNFPPPGASQPAPRPQRRRWWKGPLEFVLIIILAAVIAVFLRMFVVQVYQIPSASMANTLEVGSRIAVSRIPVLGKEIERGDVVVFSDTAGWLEQSPTQEPSVLRTVGEWLGFVAPDGDQIVVKRVIGVGGDTVACCDANGAVTVNGIPIDEPYLAPGAKPSEVEFSVEVPDGYLWMMGDNRQNSADSRFHLLDSASPFVSEESVIGRAVWEIWPLSSFSYLGNRDVFEEVGKAD